MMNLRSFISITAGILMTVLPASGQSSSGDGNNLSLSEAIQRALENNYGILISDYDNEIAAINNSWGQAGRYPTLSLDLGSNNTMTVTSSPNTGSNRLSAGLGMRWTLFNGFKVQFTKDKLESLEELSQGRTAIIIENTVQDVINAYYLALLQQERLQVFNRVAELSKDRFAAEERLKDFGGSVTYKVLQAKNIFLGDQYQLLNQEILVQTAMRNLNYFMAEEPDRKWHLTDPFVHDPHQFTTEDLLNKMASNNQTLQNQYINLEIRKTDIDLARSSFMPSVSLSTGLDNSLSNQFIVQQGNTLGGGISPYANLTLSYSIYSGGSRIRAQEIAEIGQKIAQVEMTEMTHLVSNEILNEHDAYRVRKLQLDLATESLEAAELNLGIAAEKLSTGAINSFNYRDIQLIYLNTAIQKLQAIYDLIRSHTNLTRLTGGFVQESVD